VIKVILVMKRRTDFTREQCFQHWKEVHAPMFTVKNVPGLRKYAQNQAINTKIEGSRSVADIDGLAEFWFDDIESAEAFLQWLDSSDEAEDLRKDLRSFADVEGTPIFIAEEYVLKEQ